MAQLNKVARFSWDCRCEWVSQLFDSYCLKKQVQIYRDMIGPSACNQLCHVWCSQKAQPNQVIFYIQLTLDISDQLVIGWLDVTPQQSFPAFHSDFPSMENQTYWFLVPQIPLEKSALHCHLPFLQYQYQIKRHFA